MDVQSLREAADRTTCPNNLKQIGLEMHKYEQANKRPPASRLNDGYATWAILILLQVEWNNLFYCWALKENYYMQNA